MTWTKRCLTLALALLFGSVALAQQGNSNNKQQRPKSAKKDVEAIGERDVGKGVNFYSIEKEIAMGKRMAPARTDGSWPRITHSTPEMTPMPTVKPEPMV